LSFAALLLLSTVWLLEQGKAVAQSGVATGFGSRGTTSVTLTASAVGAPLPRVQCASGYSATIYAQGLSSPDGLAFSPAGVLHVAEETAGRISQIGPGGNLTPVITGLTSPEGIAFDDAGNLYAVEDTQAGRLIKRGPTGVTTTLATDLDAPEGVVWAADDTFYVTESNIESASLLDFRTRVAAVSSSGLVTRIVTSTPIIHGTDVTFYPWHRCDILELRGSHPWA
jgi:sugar lactone lactonase YvrE